MSFSPFMTPGQSRQRRADAARRRRHRRLLALGGLGLAVLIALCIELALASRSTEGPTGAARAATHGRPADAARSATGLPLAKPALALAGVSSPAQDPVHVAFRVPPRAGLLFNLTTGQVLWERDPFERLRIASLTKMMTALIVVEHAPANARVLVTRQAVDMAGSKVGVLPVGRHVRLESMLYGLLLPSGNDAAVALAQHVARSVNRFVALMNEEAARLGLGCSRFSSPSGYYDRGNFSCTADLAVLAHLDLAQPRIARVAHTYSAVLPFPIKGGRLFLYNNNPLLIYRYPGATGLKTGQTEAAGRCLVATAERDGVRLGVVVLNSRDPGTQARQLLDRGFEDVYHLAPVPEPPMPPGA
jgi:serine-type D-Ala-D-Ala carboxypeptidase (penicillin-binding protein 5/6)